MICKSNISSYHDGTSAFFQCLSVKDPHLNAVEVFSNWESVTVRAALIVWMGIPIGPA